MLNSLFYFHITTNSSAKKRRRSCTSHCLMENLRHTSGCVYSKVLIHSNYKMREADAPHVSEAISDGGSYGRVPREAKGHRISPRVCKEHLVLYLLCDIIPSLGWLPNYATTKTQQINEILSPPAFMMEWRRVQMGTHELGIPSWPTSVSAALCKFGRQMHSTKSRIHWVLPT